MIKIDQLKKVYPGGVKALDGISMEINKGEFVVLLGPSGAGKSTLLRCLNGLVTPTSGMVKIGEITVDHNKKELYLIRKKTGMIFQQFNLVKRLRVLENVLCGRLAFNNTIASSLRLFPKSDLALAMDCLQRVGLADKALVRADQLSGGQQQRVGIARALVQQPEILLADEPVASLDPRSTDTVMRILKDINREDRITVVVSLHDIEVAKKFAERVLGIREGKVVVDKPVNQMTEYDFKSIYEQKEEDETPALASNF